MTVRVYISWQLSVFMALDIGEQEGGYMKTKIKYTDEPMGELRVVKDFLPKPEELALKEENVRLPFPLTNRASIFSRKRPKNSIRHIRR